MVARNQSPAITRTTAQPVLLLAVTYEPEDGRDREIRTPTDLLPKQAGYRYPRSRKWWGHSGLN